MKNNVFLGSPIANQCAKCCQRFVARIAKTKDSLLGKFQDHAAGYERMLHLALNEAEALAWQSEFPQLVFLDLAEEKAQSLLKWIARQRDVRSQAGIQA